VPAFLLWAYAAGGGAVSTLHDGFKPAEPAEPASGDSQSL
jgi:hypothetical protein